ESEGESVFDVKVYPNPSSGDFIFDINNVINEKSAISIYDVIGKLILSEVNINSLPKESFGQFTIHNSQLKPGIYSALVINGENRKVLRLIKIE
ncbi:MAG: T9SS type A sorting domain-containing protein, partial [Bacteroidota bacterium]